MLGALDTVLLKPVWTNCEKAHERKIEILILLIHARPPHRNWTSPWIRTLAVVSPSTPKRLLKQRISYSVDEVQP